MVSPTVLGCVVALVAAGVATGGSMTFFEAASILAEKDPPKSERLTTIGILALSLSGFIVAPAVLYLMEQFSIPAYGALLLASMGPGLVVGWFLNRPILKWLRLK